MSQELNVWLLRQRHRQEVIVFDRLMSKLFFVIAEQERKRDLTHQLSSAVTSRQVAWLSPIDKNYQR